MPQTADFILERLRAWGIGRIFGYPGDGINSLLGALDRAEGNPELIQARHEEMAAFMATAQSKFTGTLGCCMATSGGGAIHLLNGLYDAKLDHQPVVAIIGQQQRLALGSAYQQEIDPNTLYKDVSEFVQTCMHPAQARQLIDRACKVALTNSTVATVIVPEDVAGEEAVPSPPRSHGAVYTSVGWTKPRVIPPAEGRPVPRCGDRHRRSDDRCSLPDGCASDRRFEGHAVRVDPAAGTQAGPLVAGEDRGRGCRVVAGA